ncbi:MAG: proline hydroxylase [Alphaproteobacteria bacterium]|nr:proline hydroxylase [Alphaproteobacteria bacterium]
MGEVLDEAQLAAWRDDGMVVCPELIPAADVAAAMTRIKALTAERRREVILEKDGRTVRSLMNAHLFDETLGRFVRHPRLVGGARDLAGGEVYIFQSIVNLKAPFTGDIWQWHQDYPTYLADDGMPTPNCVNVLVFLEDVCEFNGPLMLIPGSHRAEAEVNEVDRSTTSYPLRGATAATVTVQAGRRGIVAPKGPPGTVVFAHTNIIHGSGPNMSPWGRTMLSLTLNAVSNRHTGSRRPDWVVLADCTPLRPLAEGEPVAAR